MQVVSVFLFAHGCIWSSTHRASDVSFNVAFQNVSNTFNSEPALEDCCAPLEVPRCGELARNEFHDFFSRPVQNHDNFLEVLPDASVALNYKLYGGDLESFTCPLEGILWNLASCSVKKAIIVVHELIHIISAIEGSARVNGLCINGQIVSNLHFANLLLIHEINDLQCDGRFAATLFLEV